MKKLKWKIKNAFDYIRYDIPQGIRSVIKWLPITWKDRHWDGWYIYTVLEYKLKETAKLHQKNQRYVGWEANVDKMNTAIKLIQLLKDDEAELSAFDEYEKKWGEGRYEFKKSEKEGYSELSIERDKIKTEEDRQRSTEDFRKMMKDAREKHEKRKNLLFKILDYKIEHWWD